MIAAEANAEKKLAPNVQAALKQVVQAGADLQALVFSASDGEGEPSYIQESRRETAAWSAAWTWAKSVSKLSNQKKSAAADQILEQLFQDGVGFVRLGNAARWAQTEQRVRAIAEHKLAGAFAEAGGGDFLTDVLDAHKALGVAAGITAPRGVTLKSGVQVAFDRWKAAIRCYVAQVIANHSLSMLADPEDKAADELKTRLLRPLTSIETASPRGQGTGVPAPQKTKAAAEVRPGSLAGT